MMMNIPQHAGDFFLTSSSGGAITRIRTPHPHDVLAGRGGGINSHEGNKVFREHVKVFKNAYNLAACKAEKARVARKVVELVQAQNPPGRFLQRDSDTGVGSYWTEIDDAKAMAKTSQALREGAPTIRAQHKDSPVRDYNNERSKRKRAATPNPVSSSTDMTALEQAPPELNIVSPLMSNASFHRSKMMKTMHSDDYTTDEDATPTLTAVSPVNTPEVLHLDRSAVAPDNYMAPSSEKESWLSEFVNPFENEEELSSLILAPSVTNGSKRSVIEDLIPMDDFLCLMKMAF